MKDGRKLVKYSFPCNETEEIYEGCKYLMLSHNEHKTIK